MKIDSAGHGTRLAVSVNDDLVALGTRVPTAEFGKIAQLAVVQEDHARVSTAFAGAADLEGGAIGNSTVRCRR